MVSLGVQTFNDRLLTILGRGYNREMAIQACEKILHSGFDTADVDLIFAIPSQKVEEAEADIDEACRLGAGQISAYPLISFSYTSIKESLRKLGVAMPTWQLERRMLQAVIAKARSAGYRRSSIWSYNRPGTCRYTTVTRDVFVGVGAGASSRIGDYFWLNTFSVADYIDSMATGASPHALATRLNPGDKMAYWLFWQCYNTAINTGYFRDTFGNELPYRIKALLSLFSVLGLARRNGKMINLTDTGAYLFHHIEKEYTHAYLETLWQTCFKEAWPDRVVL